MSHRNICVVMHALKIDVFALDVRATAYLIMMASVESSGRIILIIEA